jgi:PAS domain S-box-containing protein
VTADKFLGKTPRELAQAELAEPDARPETIRKLATLGTDHHKHIMETGEQIEVDERYLDNEGRERHMHVLKSPVLGSDGTIIGSQGILLDITQRKEAEVELAKVHSQLIDASRQAGMAEVATSVLHNVGNVLNSVNVSISVLNDNVRKSKVGSVGRVAALLNEHKETLAAAGGDPKLQRIPEYLGLLTDSLAEEQREVFGELTNLTEKVQHIKNIINAQQNYTRRVCFRESVDVHNLLEDLLSMHEPMMVKHSVTVERDFATLPRMTLEKSKLLQVLDNLIKNALESMAITEREQHVLRIGSRAEGDDAIISVTDSGHGINDEQLKFIFRFGFTTKTNGNGFGLHSAAIAMNEIGGAIRVANGGAGQGATFTITLPLKSSVETENRAAPLLDVALAGSAPVATGEFA